MSQIGESSQLKTRKQRNHEELLLIKILKYKFKKKDAHSWQSCLLLETKPNGHSLIKMVPTPPREKPAQSYSATFVNIRIKKGVFVSPLPWTPQDKGFEEDSRDQAGMVKSSLYL